MVRIRMDGDARRRLIVETVTPLFARKGFAGVTTREIAKAAGISEALLYRHFPTKAALYHEILKLGCLGDPDLARLEALPPSTDTLILIIYGMVRHMVLGELGNQEVVRQRQRLVLHSIMEDGEYARVHFADVARRILPLFKASMAAARAAGDIRDGAPSPGNAFWFGGHVACFISIGYLTEGGTIPYETDIDAVVSEAARFILRGIGLRDGVVEAPFDPARLQTFSGGCCGAASDAGDPAA